jgi:D-galactarolactone cycloisomerase
MKITAIETINLRFDYPPDGGFRYAGGRVTARVTSIVRVETNVGIVGVGAAYSHPDLVRLIVQEHLRPHLLGGDPRETEALWSLMYGLTRWYGRKGAAMSALGGLDTAFWDIRGQALERPVHELLGSERNWTGAYASGLFWHDDPAELERRARAHIAAGFTRVKMRAGRGEAQDAVAVDAVLRGIGAGAELMVDGSHRYHLASARRFAAFLAERPVVWFEEPFAPEEIDDFVALRASTSVPIAAGENDFGVQGFRELMRAGAVDIVQPDVCRAGGVTECVRIGRLAREHGLRAATHTWSDAVALVANAHVVAALPNGMAVEVDQTGNPFIDELLAEPLAIAEGRLTLPDRPGLGIELDWDVVNRLRVPEGETMRDGNYSDLVFGSAFLDPDSSFAGRTISEEPPR